MNFTWNPDIKTDKSQVSLVEVGCKGLFLCLLALLLKLLSWKLSLGSLAGLVGPWLSCPCPPSHPLLMPRWATYIFPKHTVMLFHPSMPLVMPSALAAFPLGRSSRLFIILWVTLSETVCEPQKLVVLYSLCSGLYLHAELVYNSLPACFFLYKV